MNVTVYNTAEGCWINYDVTATENRFNGYVTPGYRFFEKDGDDYVPVKRAEEYVIRKTNVKPSIYKRRFCQCYKDRYDYAFTEKTTKTTTTEKDVYYCSERDRFIDRNKRVSTRTKTEYDLPHLIVW